MSVRKILVMLGLGLGLAGCPNTQEPINTGFGDAYYHNIALQVVNPQPANAGSGPTNLDGDRAHVAIERYKANKSIQPISPTTSELGQ